VGLRDLGQSGGEVLVRDVEGVELPLDAHEKDAVLLVDVLVEVDDVPVVVVDEAGDGADEPGLVGAGREEGSRGFR